MLSELKEPKKLRRNMTEKHILSGKGQVILFTVFISIISIISGSLGMKFDVYIFMFGAIISVAILILTWRDI